MAHFARQLADSAYINSASTIGASWWQAIDTGQSKTINGHYGGTWNPTSGIAIAGAGMWFCGTSTLGSGASLTATASAPIVFGDSDYFTFTNSNTNASRTLTSDFADAVDISSGSSLMLVDAGYAGRVNYAGGAGSRVGGRLLLPLRVHHGATMTQVVFYFGLVAHANLPTTQPQFRVYAVDASGNVTSLHAGGGSTGAGYVPLGVTLAANYATTGSITYSSGAIIDTTKYCYFAEVVDESGTYSAVGNEYYSAVATFTAIPDMGPQ